MPSNAYLEIPLSESTMTARVEKSASKKRTTAKLFMHGRSQAVRLPKEYRFEGTEVRVSKVGDKVILEPLKTPFDVTAWRARLDQLGAADFLIESIPEDLPIEADDSITFA